MKITEEQIDILKEVANIGIGNAATTLSDYIGSLVDISLPDLKITTLQELIDSCPSNGSIMNTQMEGQLKGNLSFVVYPEETFKMVEILLKKKKGSVKKITEEGKKALLDTAKIVSESYIQSLAEFCKMTINPSYPTFLVGDTENTSMNKLAGGNKTIIEIKTSINIINENIYARIFLMMDKKSMDAILFSLQEAEKE